MAIKPQSLTDLLDELDTFKDRVPLDDLVARMNAIEITERDVAHVVRFGTDGYRRNPLRVGSGYSALVLCWRPGQRSPIHDHRGSSCGVKVIRGTVTETLFERTTEGHLIPSETHELQEGGVCGSQDADIHQISNLQPAGRDLITLHIYSPPLNVMGTYSLFDTKVGEYCDRGEASCGGTGT